MNCDFKEQIPDGMMDRVGQRLAAHLVIKKKKRTKNLMILLSILIVLIPASVYGLVNSNLHSWFKAIRVAHDKGKTVKLNAAFEYEKNKIIFEDAVWEENKLMISCRIVDGALWPSQFILIDENSETLNHGAGYECYDKEGALQLEFDEEKITGDKVFLSVKTLEKMSYQDDSIDYKYKLNIDKEFLTTNQAKVDKTFETEYGLITIEDINIKDGKTILTYKYDMNDKVAKLEGWGKYRMPQPEFYIKDAENNVLKSNSYADEFSNIKEAELFGVIKCLDNPLDFAIECNEKIVDWKVPIEVKKFKSEVIEVNKDVKMDSGTIRISEMTLKSAGTYLKYEFIPAKGYEDTENIRALIDIVVDGKQYICSEYIKEISGELVFPVGIDKKNIKDVKLNVFGIYRNERSKDKFILSKESTPTNFVLDGVNFNVEKMEIKEGKTYIDILIEGANRRYTDIDISHTIEEGGMLSLGVSGGLEFRDKSIEQKLEKDPFSFETSDLEKTIIRKNLEIEGEHNIVELKIDSVEYLETCKVEFKIK